MLGEGKALALSPDGKWALVVRPSPGASPRAAADRSRRAAGPSGGAAVQYHWASFFPDGRRILIAAQEKGKPPRSYIQDLSGGPPRPFAEEGMRATLVSPDGREIAGTTLEGLQLIYQADGEGRARAIPGAEPGDFLVQWSEDGKSSSFAAREDAAADALPHRSRERAPGALERARSAGHGRVRRVLSRTDGRPRDPGPPVLCLQLLQRSGESQDDGTGEIVVEMKQSDGPDRSLIEILFDSPRIKA